MVQVTHVGICPLYTSFIAITYLYTAKYWHTLSIYVTLGSTELDRMSPRTNSA